jgi:hypothetical protein
VRIDSVDGVDGVVLVTAIKVDAVDTVDAIDARSMADASQNATVMLAAAAVRNRATLAKLLS